MERECPMVNWTVEVFAEVNQECACAGEPEKTSQEAAKLCRQRTMPFDILYSMTVTRQSSRKVRARWNSRDSPFFQ